MQYNDPTVRRDLIMKHYSAPILKKELEREDINHFSTQCVDELHIQWTFERGVLKEANWNGIGCAVFQSSSDIFLIQIINKTKEEILEIAQQYENMINQNKKGWSPEIIKDLAIFENVKAQLNRLNCANMVSQSILKKLI